MVQFRDVILKNQNKLASKQDKLLFTRAVLTDAQGNQTGSGSVWADEDLRRVWAMTEGAIQPGQVLCTLVSDPYIGLGVIIGYADGSNEKEVLSDDFFLRKTGDPTGWASTSPRDLEPGGVKMLWVYPKVIIPLATYPDASGLTVNVIAGDYPYGGARKTFAGQASYTLTAPGTSGHHRYSGLYLDSANTLQVVNGTSVAVAFTPAEPTWPAGAFRLSVVQIANGATSISFDDITDRRMVWSDEQGGASAATQAEVNAGVVADEYVSPLTLANASFHGKYVKNLLYHSLTHDIWQEGTTFNDIADDTYVADLWNVLQNGQAPDISGQAGVSTDPFTRYFRCTFDSASSQAGIVQFLKAQDTVPLRGQTVSISADLWGTNVSNIRMAVIEWGGTLDTLTSDVVGTWATGNPTLATDWTYIGTPADIAVTSTRTRYKVENIPISIGTSNLAVFIWTPDEEASADLFNVADVQLERGPVATEFVARLESDERRLCLHFVWVLDATLNSVNIFIGSKFSTTLVVVNKPTPVWMRAAPTLTHNVTGYTAGAPGTTTVTLLDFGAGGFSTLTGALTLGAVTNAEVVNITLTAGTSWSGTAGQVFALRIGPSVIMVLSSRL